MAKYVWIVKYNADMTEGRGPMMFDSVWEDNREEVAAYIDAQPGVMGRCRKWSEEKYGDWTMERVELMESFAHKLRAKARAKLTPEEIAALGLTPD